MDVPPLNFHRLMSEISNDAEFLGAKISVPYKESVINYCQEITRSAQGIDAVNTIIRRASGLVVGDNTDVQAFQNCLKEQGVKRVRTALILGAGGAARVALAALRSMNCARYLIGYRSPRRPAELSSRFKGIRRQISYFPLDELTTFLNWMNSTGMFNGSPAMPRPGEEENNGKKEDDRVKRWDLLVNATPVGYRSSHSLITSENFLRCFTRVFDMNPRDDYSQLEELATAAGVELVRGIRMFYSQAEASVRVWCAELEKQVAGQPEEGTGVRLIFKRHKR